MLREGVRAWLVVVMALATAAGAQPAPSTSQEIAALEAALTEQEAAQDRAARVKTLRELVVAQRALSGDDSVYTWRRELALMAMLDQVGEYRASIDLQEGMLAKAERQHGKDSGDVRASRHC